MRRKIVEFVVCIEMGSENLLNPHQGRRELRAVFARLRQQLDNGAEEGSLSDSNGRIVGHFGFKTREE